MVVLYCNLNLSLLLLNGFVVGGSVCCFLFCLYLIMWLLCCIGYLSVFVFWWLIYYFGIWFGLLSGYRNSVVALELIFVSILLFCRVG